MTTIRMLPERRGLGERRAEPGTLDEAALRRIYDSGIVGVALWDGAGRIVEANARFLEIFGYGRADVTAGRLDWQRLCADEHPEGAHAMPHAARGAESAAVFKEYVRRDGERVYARVHSTPIGGGRALSVVVDATEQRRAQDERAALLERERAAREEAEAASRSREDILAIVSHDLRSPLNTIAMSLAVIEKGAADARHAPALGIVRRAIASMDRLIQDLLEVNLISAGRLPVEPRLVEVAVLLEDARQAVAALAAAKSQRFEVARADCGRVLADRDRIGQLIANLAGNAVKYTPEGGAILLDAEPADGEVRFRVSDTGPGIDAQDLPHIFDPFWQARRVRRGGVGLGLPIAKGIVDAHGGRIWVRSAPGLGSQFFFTLPRAGSASL